MVEETARALTREDLLREVVRRTAKAPMPMPEGAYTLSDYVAAVKAETGQEISEVTASRWLEPDVEAGNTRKGKWVMDGRARLVYWPVGNGL